MYKSLGTITIEPDGDAGGVKVFFVPEHDYSIKHEEDKYAIYVRQGVELRETRYQEHFIVRRMDGMAGGANIIILKGIGEIAEFSDMKGALDQMLLHAQVRAAATTQSRVQVCVAPDPQDGLQLTNIMPA